MSRRFKVLQKFDAIVIIIAIHHSSSSKLKALNTGMRSKCFMRTWNVQHSPDRNVPFEYVAFVPKCKEFFNTISTTSSLKRLMFSIPAHRQKAPRQTFNVYELLTFVC